MNTPQEKLLSMKELADALGRSRKYIWAMTQKGFIMPGRRATLSYALAWLARNPSPFEKIHHNK